MTQIDSDINLPITIPFNRTKLALVMIGAMICFVFYLWLIYMSLNHGDTFHSNLTIDSFFAVFSGIVMVVFGRRYLSQQAGIVIHKTGISYSTYPYIITINISWQDVSEIVEVRHFLQRSIFIKVNDPGMYIEQAPTSIARRIMKTNYLWFNTPFRIFSFGLKISISEIAQLLQDNFAKYKQDQNGVQG